MSKFHKGLFYLTITFVLISRVTALFAITHSVAVMPFENVNKDSALDWLSMGIPETVTNSLLAVNAIVLVERIQLRKVMDEQKLHLTGAIDDSTVVRVGKLIGANILVVGAFQKQEETIRLTARFVDVETGGVLQTAKVTGKMNDIFDLQVQVVKDLAKNLNIELKQQELAKLSERPTESLEAYQHFGQGSLLQARKDLQGAVKELQKATEIDAKFALARERFKEVFWSLNHGNNWTYETSSESKGIMSTFNSISTYTRRAGGLEDFNGVTAFTYIEEGSGETTAGGKSNFTVTQYYSKGDDGIYYLGQKKEITSTHNKTALLNVLDAPVLIFPYEVSKGKKWKSNYSVRRITKVLITSDESTIKFETTHKILGTEKVTVPAGTFDCFIVKSENAVEGSDYLSSGKISTTYWFATGVGIIKEVQNQKESNFMGSKMTSEKFLRSYHIE